MNKAPSVGDKLAALSALRDAAASSEVEALLRQALADQSNRVVARGAEVAGDTGAHALVPDLRDAYRRLMVNPLQNDPGCLGKTAIVRALVKLNCEEAEIYRAGVAFEQPDPVWGGQKDSAAELRGLCVLGLVGCASGVEVLNRCADLLADPCVEARTAAAQAVAALRQPEGGPLLRLKIQTGDARAEVIGECCAGLLRLGAADDVDFVMRLLSSESVERCVQAALALGESRVAEAFEPMRLAWDRQTDADVRADLLICLGLLRSPEASDFLLSLIDRRDLGAAAGAIKALKAYGRHSPLRERIAAAVNRANARQLAGIFAEEWGEDLR
jgi:HEAT repeat protein